MGGVREYASRARLLVGAKALKKVSSLSIVYMFLQLDYVCSIYYKQQHTSMYHYISLIIDYYLEIVEIDLLILRYQSHVHWYGIMILNV